MGAGDIGGAITGFSITDRTLQPLHTANCIANLNYTELIAIPQNSGVLIDLGGGDSVFLLGLTLADISGLNLLL